MKNGTIFLNHFAGDENPIRYFIYIGTTGKFINAIDYHNGKLRKSQYHKDDFLNSGKFEEVGYCNAFEIMKSDLSKLINID